jgi:hypothetical protein
MTSAQWFSRERAALVARHPSVRIVVKESSLAMRVLAVLAWPLDREWMGNAAVTLGRTVYLPAAWFDTTGGAETLRHEGVHLDQQARMGRALFYLAYLFPPFGWTFRARLEREAYEAGMRFEMESTGTISDATVEWLATTITGWGYVWAAMSSDAERAYWRRVRARLLAERKE